MRATLLLLAGVLLGVQLASALYTKGGPVSMLSPASFDKVLQSKVPVMVEFFAPWCGHCKQLSPAYTKAAEKMAGIVPFVAVDCDAEKNKPLCGKYGIQGFPTLKIFSNGKPSDYQGERSAKAMVGAVTAQLSAKHVKELKSGDAAAAFLKGAGAKVLLLTDKGAVSPLYKSLSMRYAGKLSLAQAHKSVGDLAEKYATTFPTLVVFPAEGEPVTYEGELKPQKLIDFLKTFAGGASEGAKEEPKPKAEKAKKEEKPKAKKEEKPKAKKEEKPKAEKAKKEEEKAKKEEEKKAPEVPAVVKNVTLSGLKALLGEEGAQVLAFYNHADACAEKLAAFNAAVHATGGAVRASQVPVTAAQAPKLPDIYPVDAAALGGEACSLQLFVLPHDDKDDTDEWKPYGGALEARELAKFAMEFATDKYVTPVDEETHQQWVSTDPSRAKVLLFTDKEEPPALFRALAANLQTLNMDFGMATGVSAEFKQRFNVQKVPSIFTSMLKPSTDEVGPDGKPKMMMSALPYTGRMNYKDISQFLMMLALQLGTAGPGQFDDLLGRVKPPTVVAELVDEAALDAACTSRGGICVIATLDPASPKHEEHLESLRAVAALREGQPLAFSWVAAKQHAGFVRGLGAQPESAASLVAFSPKKLRGAVMTSAFTKASIGDFLEGVLTGKVSTAPMAAMPELGAPGVVEEEAPEEAPIEEEFDLSDIMSEEIEDSALGKKKDEL